MLFWLKKAVSYWLMPLPLGLALMVAGLLLLRSARWPRAGRRLLVTGVLLLLVLSNKQVGHALLRPLENRYAAQPELAAGAPLPAPLAACRAKVKNPGSDLLYLSLSRGQESLFFIWERGDITLGRPVFGKDTRGFDADRGRYVSCA